LNYKDYYDKSTEFVLYYRPQALAARLTEDRPRLCITVKLDAETGDLSFGGMEFEETEHHASLKIMNLHR
jgi:hypothetical protein